MKLKPLLLALVLLLLTGLAQAQNFVYSFYDGPNGTGNLLATYTGPLITSTTSGPTSAFTINPGALYWARVFGSPFLQITATSIQPCVLTSSSYGADGTVNSPVNISILCVQFVTDSSGVVVDNVAIRANLDALWPGPGTYNAPIVSFNPYPVIGVFEDQVVSPYYYAISQGVASTVISAAEPTYSCSGFQSPFDVAITMKSKTNRAIPLKAQLFNGSAIVDTGTLGTASPPMVNVVYNSISGTGTDETALLDPLGQSSSGNQFNFDSTTGTWWFNLATTPFTASGTYTVTLQSGDATKYLVSPQCSGTFVRQ